MEYISSCGTIKNSKLQDKPNEDLVLCDDNEKIYILLDGVSRDKINGVYPNPSPAKEVSELFAKVAFEYLKNTKKKYDLNQIKNAFIEGNKAIADYNKDYAGDFLPGTVGIICLIADDELLYGYIGDCYGRLIKASEIDLFTTCQTEKIAQHKKEFSAYEIRNEICNNIEHPYSYGVLTGQAEAVEFVKMGSCSLCDVDTIFLASDGLEPYLKNLSASDFKSGEAETYLKASITGDKEDDKAAIVIRKSNC